MDEIKKEVDTRDERAKALGAIKCIEVEDKRLYLKMPSRNIIGIAFAQLTINQIQAYETIAKASALREVSDMDIIENDILFLSVMTAMAEFLGEIELKKSTSRNL